MQCPRCHQVQQAQNRFCSHCGNPLPQQPSPGYLSPAPQPFQPAPQPYPPAPQPYQPTPQVHAPYQPVWQQPAPPAQTLWGRPLRFWLLLASAIAIVALLMPWYSQQTSGRVTWKETGYEYSDGTRNTWYLPEVSASRYGGGNGLNLFTLALAGTIGALAFRFGRGAWPRWAIYALTGVVGLVTWIGVGNLLSDPNLGPLLFTAAGGLAIPGTLALLRGR